MDKDDSAANDVLVASAISKRFGDTVVLKDLDLSIKRGEVHALLGHNGSGKSTFVKIVAGYHVPTTGDIWIDGVKVEYPLDAVSLRKMGVGVLHQDIGLVNTMTVMENLRVGYMETGIVRQIKWAQERRRVQRMLDSFELSCRPDTIVGRLSQVERVQLGLIRAFQGVEGESKLVVLDEPTATLGLKETNRLLKTICSVARNGAGILFICHNPTEAVEVADRITILRNGVAVYSETASQTTEAVIVQEIIGPAGEDAPALTGRAVRAEGGNGAPQGAELRVSSLSGRRLRSFDLEVRAGESVGITGLAGSGVEEIGPLIYGAAQARGGQIWIGDRQYSARTPWRSTSRGLGYVSADRLGEGAVASATVAENMSVTWLKKTRTRFGRIGRSVERRLVSEVMESLEVVPNRPTARMVQLSGGNQQKVLVGRWLPTDAKVFILCEPTAGVDVGAVRHIYAAIQTLLERGGCAVIWSSAIEELLAHCHRIIVIRDGCVAGEVVPGPAWQRDRILEMCYGGAG